MLFFDSPLPVFSAGGKLHLDTPIPAVSLRGISWIDGVEFSESGGGHPLLRNTLTGQIAYDRYGARRRQLPVRGKICSSDGYSVGMPVHPENPVQVVRNGGNQTAKNPGELLQFPLAIFAEFSRSRGKQQFRLQNESVSLDADQRIIGDDTAQAAKKFGTIALQVGNPPGQFDIEPFTEILNLLVLFIPFKLGLFQSLADFCKLALQLIDFLIE